MSRKPTGRFRPEDRLLDSRDFRRVMREGRRRAHPDVVLMIAEKPEKHRNSEDLGTGRGSRLGITASRKVGNAVRRNRFKRRVRAWFRDRRHDLGRDVDLVVIARKSGVGLDFAELDARLGQLLGLGQTPS